MTECRSGVRVASGSPRAPLSHFGQGVGHLHSSPYDYEHEHQHAWQCTSWRGNLCAAVGFGRMRSNKLPTIFIVVAALAVLGLAIALRRGVQPPEPTRGQPSSAVEAGEHVRSARVEERLQLLREAYAHGEHASEQAEAQPNAGAAPLAPANTNTSTATRQADMRRGRRASWRVSPPPPAAGTPKRKFQHDPHSAPYPHAAVFDRRWDSAKIQDTILNGTDPEERRAALDFLTGEDDALAISILTTALLANDPDPSFRAAVVAAFGDFSDQISADLLDLALRDEAPQVRFEAIAVLADMDSPAARTAIQASVNDPDPDVRDLAQGILDMQ